MDGHSKVQTCPLRGFLTAFAVAVARDFRFLASAVVLYEVKTHRFLRKTVAANPSCGTRRQGSDENGPGWERGARWGRRGRGLQRRSRRVVPPSPPDSSEQGCARRRGRRGFSILERCRGLRAFGERGDSFPSLLGVFPPFFTMGHLRGSELLDVSAWPAIGLASTKIKKEIFHLLLLYYIPQKNLTNFILFLKKGYTHSTQAQGGT